MMEFKINSIESDIEKLLSRVFEMYVKEGTVNLSVECANDAHRSGKSISVIPRRLGAAPIIAYCENGGAVIYLTIGRNTSLELALEGNSYTNLKGAEELIAITKAVIEGRFEEDIWIRDSKIVKSVGRIFIDAGRPITITNSYFLTNPFVSLEKEVCMYLPYRQRKEFLIDS